MWFITLLLGILAGRYLWHEIENWVVFHRARNEKDTIKVVCSNCERELNET